jgi:hypothetical protein
VVKRKYNILEETLCLYCQREYARPANLQKHVLKKHPHTNASESILGARRKL